MPVMVFRGNDSWGYNPTFFFAPDKAYGTENDLKAFIDKCHENGIAVILDIVLNHADYEFPYVKLYWNGTQPAPDNPFFNQQATHPYSVFFDFNHESEATRELVERVCRFWLQEYKVDGFRFDLSKGFTQKNTGGNVSAWSSYDAGRVATLKRIFDEIRAYDPTAYVVLEHFAENREEKELAGYGMLFWGNLNHDYRSAAKGSQSDLSWGSYREREWQHPYVMGYMESHDEERLLYDVLHHGRAGTGYSTQELPTALNRAKLAAAFFFTLPGPKLIWQFGELGYDIPIDHNGRTGAKPVRWDYQQDPERQKLYQVYAELIRLKSTQPVFQTTDFNLALEGQVKKITLRHPDMQVFVIGNFDVQHQSTPAGFPAPGTWYDHFTGEEVTITDPEETIALQPGEFRLYTSEKLPAPEAGLVPWQEVVLTAAEEEAFSHNLSVYPNPTAHTVMVELHGDYTGEISLQLTDMIGRVLWHKTGAKTSHSLRHTLLLEKMNVGLYFLKVSNRRYSTVRKIVKVK